MSEGKKKSEVKPNAESRKRKAISKLDQDNISDFDIPHSALKETPTAKLQPQAMEVHHHPQLEHKPKPWKEYLLEYFMIFLAVMTGFFAESYREHLGERSKEHEYVVNIKKDLLTETRNLNIWIPSIYARVKRFDTLISYLE